MSAPARLLACLLPAVLAGSACDVAMSADGIDGAFERNLTVSGPLELEVGSGSGDIVVRTGPAGAAIMEATKKTPVTNWSFRSPDDFGSAHKKTAA